LLKDRTAEDAEDAEEGQRRQQIGTAKDAKDAKEGLLSCSLVPLASLAVHLSLLLFSASSAVQSFHRRSDTGWPFVLARARVRR
jgi:hypothetical protein